MGGVTRTESFPRRVRMASCSGFFTAVNIGEYGTEDQKPAPRGENRPGSGGRSPPHTGPSRRSADTPRGPWPGMWRTIAGPADRGCFYLAADQSSIDCPARMLAKPTSRQIQGSNGNRPRPLIVTITTARSTRLMPTTRNTMAIGVNAAAWTG